MITSVASALFTNLPTNTGLPPTTTSTSGLSNGSRGESIIGVIVACVIVGLILIGIAIFCLRRRYRSSAGIDLTNTEAHRPLLKWSGFRNSFRQLFMDTQVITRTK
jgi:hypothetical protein